MFGRLPWLVINGPGRHCCMFQSQFYEGWEVHAEVELIWEVLYLTHGDTRAFDDLSTVLGSVFV